MVGGTHADHSDVEKRTLETYGAATQPYTDAQIDALCVEAEAGILAYLSSGAALPTAKTAKWTQVIVDVVLNMLDLATARKIGRGSITHADASGESDSFPGYGTSPYTRDIVSRAQRLMETSSGVDYGDSVA